MEELNATEIESVNGGIRQLTGFTYYVLSGGDIIFMNDLGEKITYSF